MTAPTSALQLKPTFAHSIAEAESSPLILRAYYSFYVAVVLASALSSLIPSEMRAPVDLLGEVLTVLSLPIAALGYQRISGPGRAIALLFGAFVLAEVLSAIVFPLRNFPQVWAAALGILLDAKLFVLMLATAYFASRDLHGAAKFFHIILWIFVGLAWINLPFALRDLADGRSNIYGDYLYRRGGFVTPTGIYRHKAIAAQMALLAVISSIALLSYVRSRGVRAITLWSIGLGVLQVVIGLSVKELIGLLFIGIIYFSQKRGSTRPDRLFAMTLAGGLLVVGMLSINNRVTVAAIERIDRYTGEESDSRIRNLLIKTSVQIAQDNFPLGTGPGTFASEPSRSLGYSPVYLKYKFYRYVGGRADGEVQYLVDGFWPKILGESGVFGFLFYVSAIILVLLQVAKMRRRFPDAQLFLFIQYVWIAVMPISLASGILTNERFVLVLAMTGVCLVRISNQRIQNV